MTIEEQINFFRQGFPWLDVTAPATPERGIEVLGGDARDEAAAYGETDENGAFTVDHLVPGNYELRLPLDENEELTQPK